MNQKSFRLATLACFAALAVGCQQETAAPAAAPVEPVVEEAQPTPDIVPAANPSTDGAGFDMRAFAGTFGDETTTVELRPDGTYEIVDRDAAGGGEAVMDGTWTVEADDRHIRLDPNTKAEEDRLFAISSDDELQTLDAEGQPASDGRTLSRQQD
ncbi:copper resistance protein NlpE N-terminal domain-containing protein [Novilysobacter spongiicola]|uniref:NlpE N-terminal domain-containing protein n=1 Tax=Lysobacter spongiicola DSM 21749 TaxID=1122188 RepID=A0A1T4MPE6_9GAMM|nr:copper resistance protein NlpE N-terminal domain-containing protein [Lysobacter spongiicola]SJZ68909.1 NlpE N-terminal domain-containing protein [Lysobacter spongiicola DSM 21749]